LIHGTKAQVYKLYVTFYIFSGIVVLKLLFFSVQFISLLIGFVYFDQTYDQKGVQNINGCMFLMQVQMTFGNLFAVLNVSLKFFVILVYNKYFPVCVFS